MDRHTNILLVAGGTEFFPPPEQRYDHIIAADSGGEFLFRRQLPAHQLVGDFDSISPEALDYHSAQGAQILRFPPDKDFTDLELALNALPQATPARVHAIGIFGGKRDQEWMNLFLLSRFTEGRFFTFDLPQGCGGLLGPGKLTIRHGKSGTRASLLALPPAVRGIYATGVKWPLADTTLTFGESRGISNETLGGEWSLEWPAGTLLWLIDGVSHATVGIEWHPALPDTQDEPGS